METTNWGRWGDTDERGALNLLTPEVVASAAASITTGKVYSLGIPIQSKGVPLMDYRGTPMRLTLQNESDDGIYAMYGCHRAPAPTRTCSCSRRTPPGTWTRCATCTATTSTTTASRPRR